MKRRSILLAMAVSLAFAGNIKAQDKCGPTPTVQQLKLQDMEMYAFIHYSLNTYTDQEWGFGDEAPKLFNPKNLDTRQWVQTCKNAGMKGIIFTAKHHCGFCMWPSKYTEYSVKNSPWKNGQGDVVRELADECRKAGMKFAVYLSPWDRNHPEYGRKEYVTYFRNQLRELLSDYGDVFEVWFDGANGGNGWYGGANETRQIDRLTYYEWDETYRMIRELQPNCIIWNDGSDRRGDLRWVGTEAGFIGETNWSLMKSDCDCSYPVLHYGVEDGDVWCPGETNTSIRPGWFYHDSENGHVKSLSRLMETYYKSVGRNSTLLLNFPIDKDGLIHSEDSIRGVEFHKMIRRIFDHPLEAERKLSPYESTLSFGKPVAFNRLAIGEDITRGQRVRRFKVEALDEAGNWTELRDVISEEPQRSMTTIGRKRILCFPTTTTREIKVTVTDSKAEPVISALNAYLAPEIDWDKPENGEKISAKYNIFFNNAGAAAESMFIDLGGVKSITGIRFLPNQKDREGTPLDYTLLGQESDGSWKVIAKGEFSNIINNPIWQTVKFSPCKYGLIRLDCSRITSGKRIYYDDIEIVTE